MEFTYKRNGDLSSKNAFHFFFLLFPRMSRHSLSSVTMQLGKYTMFQDTHNFCRTCGEPEPSAIVYDRKKSESHENSDSNR